MNYLLITIAAIPLLVFNMWAWYTSWEEAHSGNLFKTKVFYFALFSYVSSIGIIYNYLDNLKEINYPVVLTIEVFLFSVYIYLVYLSYKQGKSKLSKETI